MTEQKEDMQPQVRKPTMPVSDESVMMSIAFANAEADIYIKKALLSSLLITLFLVWTPLPSLGSKFFATVKEENKPQKRRVLKPPPEKPLDKVQTQEKKVKKVPVPDLTPDEPEPLVEPDPPKEPDILPTDDWEIAIPDGPPPQGDTIARVGQVGVEPPVFTKKVKPVYPERAAKIKIQGYVILEAILRRSGKIDDIKVLRGLGKGKFGFEEEAIAALKQWKFLPGKVNNKPADVRMTLKIDFILQ